MYPMQEEESKTYSLEISRVFGFLSILFAYIIPFTGLLMGGFGLYYEHRNAKEHDFKYNKVNLVLNAIGMVYGGLNFIFWIVFKLKLFG